MIEIRWDLAVLLKLAKRKLTGKSFGVPRCIRVGCGLQLFGVTSKFRVQLTFPEA